MSQAVVVIDVQRAFFEPEPLPAKADQTIENINRLTVAARAASVPVVFIYHERPQSGLYFNSDEWQLQRDLITSEDDQKVRKTTPDSFLETDLQALLTEMQVDELIICGFASEFCVDTTTRRAAGLGYKVKLVTDAHTTHDKAHASGQQISLHHSNTLTSIASFPQKVIAVTSETISF
ncbi:cysteine hydrolase family protein [Aliamphritea ceti]|uniref:cysteine hydrolase family protein n=1 Tax=Aliamphritea ceti TaxID=1524258 RepID=UPI0021C27030|nr:cysteine hydrolase family protein [Aliamphritea ceti]